MGEITTVGIDLAKNVFSVHGVDAHGKTVLRKTVSRGRLNEPLVQLQQCIVGMEARSGAHPLAQAVRSARPLDIPVERRVMWPVRPQLLAAPLMTRRRSSELENWCGLRLK
jgi:hypothetical protein